MAAGYDFRIAQLIAGKCVTPSDKPRPEAPLESEIPSVVGGFPYDLSHPDARDPPLSTGFDRRHLLLEYLGLLPHLLDETVVFGGA